MEQAVLTPVQKQALEFIAHEPRLARFYLSGGTALAAYYLHHRFSEDLDFFTTTDPDRVFLEEFVSRLKKEIGATTIRAERLFDRNMFLFSFLDKTEALKIEFTRYPFPQLNPPEKYDGIVVDSMRDIAANKLMALLDRFDPKDFVDLFFLLQKTDLSVVRADAQKKFDIAIGDLFLGSELAKARRIEALPKMITTVGVAELKDFFSQEAKKLGPQILQ